jgi:RNA polymerase sigma factor (sigma-70 family)
VRDFQQAEDVVQEAFMAAWSALPTLAEPAAFPGWLRGIVRHQAFRVLRRKHPPTTPLSEADQVPGEDPTADHQLDQRRQATAVLAAIAQLPQALREPATLFFVHECSHQDIAAFLGLSVTTVNNRLHAARSQLKQRMLTMMTETLHAHVLPDDFAHRIGRLIAARGNVVDVLFDPSAVPDFLTELALSDETQRSTVTVQVVQRPGGGIARGIAIAPVGAVPRGATVLSSGRHTDTPVSGSTLEQIVPVLAGPSPVHKGAGRLLETGIKVIDLLCPLVAGGSAAIAGEYGVGISVVLEELVRRLSGGRDRISIFVPLPPPSPEWPPTLDPNYSHAEAFKAEGYSDGTMGAVQTFLLRGEGGPWTADRLSALAPIDTVIHLSRPRIRAKIYPGVDVLTSRSRLLETNAVGDEHARIAERARQALTRLWTDHAGGNGSLDLDAERALKLQNFFTQPFFVAEPYTKRPGTHVSLADTLSTCASILDGQYDDLPIDAFFFSGDMTEIRTNVGRKLAFGPVTI